MDFKDWEIIKTISEELSLTKTAEKLYTSQPALTYRLNKLEEELGVNILVRHSSGVGLTKEGEYLAEYSKKMLLEYEFMKKHINNLKLENEKTINIGVSTTVAKYKLASILHDFKEKYPDIKINLKTGASSSELPILLKENKIQLALLRGDGAWGDVKYIVNSEPYGIITNFPFDAEKLQSLPYIQHETKNVVYSKFYLEEWAKFHLGKDKKFEVIKVDSTEASLEMAKNGIGWTVLPKIHIQNFNSLFFYPMSKPDGTFFERETYLLTKEENLEKNEIKSAINFILENKTKYFK